MKDWA